MKSIASKGKEDQDNLYDFKCEGCNCEVEIAVPEVARRFNCPAGCGASYLQWINKEIPTITCVICPVFFDEK